MVGIVKLQRLVYRPHDGAGGNGGTGKLVELPPVLFHLPALAGRVVQAAPGQAVDPVAFAGFNFITQPRGFLVLQYAHTRQVAVGHDANQQADAAAVAVRCGGLQNDGTGPVIQKGQIGRLCSAVAQQRVIQHQGVFQQVVVVAAGRQNFGQGLQLGLLAGCVDAAGGALLDNGDNRHGDGGKQAQYAGVFADGAGHAVVG